MAIPAAARPWGITCRPFWHCMAVRTASNGARIRKIRRAYYYDSPYQKGVSLVIIMRHNEPYVDDIILTSTPIKNIQDPMERYGLK